MRKTPSRAWACSIVGLMGVGLLGLLSGYASLHAHDEDAATLRRQLRAAEEEISLVRRKLQTSEEDSALLRRKLSAQPSTHEISLVPATCDPDPVLVSSFDGIYERGFTDPQRYARIRPYMHSKNAQGEYDITPEQIAHYYTLDEHRYSLSGDGSIISAVTPTAQFIGTIVKREKIFSVLDVPCGDVNWQMYIPELDRAGLYVGMDIARFPLKLAKARFAHHRNKLFASWDLSKCRIPQWSNGTQTQPFDLVHLRDVIQHMTFDVAKQTIRNIVDTGAACKMWFMARAACCALHVVCGLFCMLLSICLLTTLP